MSKYSLVVDSCESHLISLLQRKYEIPFTVKSLDVGDIAIRDEEGNSVLIMERKTIKDLASSITGPRYRNQKIRLQNCGCMGMYIIEGICNQEEIGIPIDTIYSSWAGIMLRDNLLLTRTVSLEETAKIVILNTCTRLQNSRCVLVK